MSERKPARRRKPKNTEWIGNVLYGRKRIKGKLRRWSLRTDDVEIARTRVKEDIKRLMATAYYPDNRVRYKDVFASWGENYIVHQVGPNSAKRYAVSLRQLEPILLPLFLDEITEAKVDEIVIARRAQGVVTATIKRDLVALGSVLKFARIKNNPALACLQTLKERRDPIMLPEPAHIQRMIARCPGRMSTLVHVAWLTGCRLSELVTAQRASLDHTHRQLAVIGKGNKRRTIDIDFGGAYELLCALPAHIGCRWLFWHGEGLPYKNLSSRFAGLVQGEYEAAQREARKAGHSEPAFRPFGFHHIRHRHAVDWLKEGRSIYVLQKRLGHRSVKTTEIYLEFLTPEEQQVAMYGPTAAPAQRADVVALASRPRSS